MCFFMSMQSCQLNEPTCSLSPHIKSSVELIMVPKIYNDETEIMAVLNPLQMHFFFSASPAEKCMCMGKKDTDCKVQHLPWCHQWCEVKTIQGKYIFLRRL